MTQRANNDLVSPYALAVMLLVSVKHAEIADWLLRLSITHKPWRFGSAFYTSATSKAMA